nr:N-acetylmuramoyl-L-alanine amidase [Metabacillus iocasae]
MFGALSLFTSSYNHKQSPSLFHVSVTANLLNVRNGPGLSFPIINQVEKDRIFSVLDVQGEWYAVQLEKRVGWISSDHVIETSNSPFSPQQKEALSVPAFTHESTILNNKTIVLDAGHGGEDKGAIGTQGTYEKDLTLRTVLLLKQKLKAAGASVILTRQDDSYLSLSSRTMPSRLSANNVFLSIHYNSMINDQVEGIMTYYYNEHEDLSLASHIHKELVTSTSLHNKKVRFGDYYVLRENPRPSALIELGFLSNANEETYINSLDYQHTITTSIVNGLVTYFSERAAQ